MILIRTHSIDLRISENLLEREQSLSAIVQTMKSVVTISIPAIDCVFVLFLLFLARFPFCVALFLTTKGEGLRRVFPVSDWLPQFFRFRPVFHRFFFGFIPHPNKNDTVKHDYDRNRRWIVDNHRIIDELGFFFIFDQTVAFAQVSSALTCLFQQKNYKKT